MKVNGDDCRTIDDIDMKLGPLIKLDNRNNMTSRKIDDNVMRVNYDEVFIFPNYGQFGTICRPDSQRIVHKTYIFINSYFLSYKNWKQSSKISNTVPTLLLWVKVIFLSRNAVFCKTIQTSAINSEEGEVQENWGKTQMGNLYLILKLGINRKL